VHADNVKNYVNPFQSHISFIIYTSMHEEFVKGV